MTENDDGKLSKKEDDDNVQVFFSLTPLRADIEASGPGKEIAACLRELVFIILAIIIAALLIL